MTVGAVIIAKNEENSVEKMLESVKDFDEIVFVDTGSTDKTIEIAKKYTDKIFHFDWCDDFSAARNFAIENATADWLMSIDCDHWMMDPFENVKSAVINADNLGHSSGFVSLHSNGKTFSHQAGFLFQRVGAYWSGDVHEVINPRPTFNADIKQAFGYSETHKNDPDRNLRILLKSENKSARTLFYLGREYYERKQYENAIERMSEFIKVGTWNAEIAEAYITLARCYWFTQQGDKAREMCLQAIRVNPDLKEALLFMSELHFEPWKTKWERLAGAATNDGVLFVRT